MERASQAFTMFVSISVLSTTPKPEPLAGARGSSSPDDNGSWHRPSPTRTRPGPGVATMSGFYFRQNSEPYQQLSIQHVPETVSTSFDVHARLSDGQLSRTEVD